MQISLPTRFNNENNFEFFKSDINDYDKSYSRQVIATVCKKVKTVKGNNRINFL